MTLRIRRTGAVSFNGGATPEADNYASRLAKLIPAEALGLYGAGSSMVAGAHNQLAGWVLAIACVVLAGAVRYMATRDSAGKPEWPAIGIAVISFVLWMLSLPAGSSPISLGSQAILGGLIALIWATVVPIFYK